MLINGTIHKPESVLENETLKIFWELEVQSDHRIPARRTDLVWTRTCHQVDFDSKISKIDKYLDLTGEITETLWNMKVMVITIVVGAHC